VRQQHVCLPGRRIVDDQVVVSMLESADRRRADPGSPALTTRGSSDVILSTVIAYLSRQSDSDSTDRIHAAAQRRGGQLHIDLERRMDSIINNR
jgi:hypothetical protein